MKKLTSQKYWNNATINAKIQLSNNDPIKLWINHNFYDFDKIKNCIEIGCFPGRFLTIFGDQKITVNGIDYVDNLYLVEENLKSLGYKTGKFINADITEYTSNEKYNCVMSFGLIEHFINWEEILEKHIELVENNGYLIIEVPNFKGIFQRIPRQLFDKENFARHNIDSMNLEKWKKILEKNNFKIINASYFGGYDVWFENNDLSNFKKNIRNKLISFFKKLKKVLKKEDSKHFSSYIGIIAQKN